MTNYEDLNGFSFNGGLNQPSNLTAEVAGRYDVFWRADGDGQNNHVYYGSVYIDGEESMCCGDRKKMTAGGDITALSNGCIISLDVGDVVDIKIRDETGTGTGNIYISKLKLVRVGN